MRRSFAAKVLLFGEYTVIHGSAALAIPFRQFEGRWDNFEKTPHEWNPLLRFLQANPGVLDLERLERDLEAGHGFNSTIPQGKGLGSSGALVAALYDEYALDKSLPLDQTQRQLAQLEGHYHGQSSGVDPLVSWIDRPLLLKGSEIPQAVDLPLQDWSKAQRFFLLDSHVARHSAPLIAVFKQKRMQQQFQATLAHLQGLVSECIEDYQNLDEAHMGLHMEELSNLQLEAFQEMIPPKLRDLWVEGLSSRRFALKICGAGGGGYFIGYRLKGELPDDALAL